MISRTSYHFALVSQAQPYTCFFHVLPSYLCYFLYLSPHQHSALDFSHVPYHDVPIHYCVLPEFLAMTTTTSVSPRPSTHTLPTEYYHSQLGKVAMLAKVLSTSRYTCPLPRLVNVAGEFEHSRPCRSPLRTLT